MMAQFHTQEESMNNSPGPQRPAGPPTFGHSMMRTTRLLAVCTLALLSITVAQLHAREQKMNDFPPLAPAADTVDFGRHIQRTMRLLATSTPDDRHKARILFYGQSITGTRYSSIVEKWLRETFPHADIELVNRALGGYAAHQLYRPAENDLYPFYPDLLVFHVYGDRQRYKEIIANTRKRTTAEVMIVTNHWKRNSAVDGKLPPDLGSDDAEEFLAQLAEKYDCELVRVRGPWYDYMSEHDLLPGELVRDNVHLNEHGKWLTAQLIQRQMIYRPDLDTDADDLVKEITIGQDVDWADGKITLDFDGNRVDLVSRTRVGTCSGAAVLVRVDGRKPSEFPELYAHTRPTSLVRPHEWPAVARVAAAGMPVVEQWRAEILSVDRETPEVRFKVTGSVTGEDGTGTSREDFVSDSGRVLIEAVDWAIYENRQKSYAPGMAFYWDCVPMHVDVYQAPITLDDVRESAVTLFQGLPNGKHRLELTVEGGAVPPPVSIIRIYRPPLRDA
jgi:hypothetical protein